MKYTIGEKQLSWLLQTQDELDIGDFDFSKDQLQWISVDDALPKIPEGEGRVRVLTYEGKLEGVVRVSDFYYVEVGLDNFTHSFITHWQPIPTPPEGK